MRTALLAVVLVLGVASACLAQAKGPQEIAGIRLGDSVEKYSVKFDREITEEELDRPYLTVSALLPLGGFRSGYVTYGNCVSPKRIVRIKMNYENESKEFYDRVLAALKKRYGDPQEWRGNAFGTLRTWKWSFTDPALGDVSLILQHYSGTDDAFTHGNSIRLTALGLAKAERACYRANHPGGPARIGPALAVPEFEALLPH